jgi:hypothetical protein
VVRARRLLRHLTGVAGRCRRPTGRSAGLVRQVRGLQGRVTLLMFSEAHKSSASAPSSRPVWFECPSGRSLASSLVRLGGCVQTCKAYAPRVCPVWSRRCWTAGLQTGGGSQKCEPWGNKVYQEG